MANHRTSTADSSSASAQRTWTRTPVGSQRSTHAPGTAAYFSDLRAYRYGYETPFIPRFFRFQDLCNHRVLEIGVGNGIDALEIARAGAFYTGIDVTQRHVELAYANFETAGLEPPDIRHGDLLTAGFEREFDVVYSFGVLHHIPEEEKYLRRIHSILRPGGRLMIGVYSKYSFFNAYLLASWLLRSPRGTTLDNWRSHVAELSELGDPVTIRIRSKSAMALLAKQTGFAVERYQKRGFTQRNLPIIGRMFAPDGRFLSACGAVLGWYHLFELRAVPGGPPGAH